MDCLPVWWECGFFNPAEQAALRRAKALTDISHSHAPDALYASLGEHCSEQQIVDLTLIISVMNTWNRIAIALDQHPAPRRA